MVWLAVLTVKVLKSTGKCLVKHWRNSAISDLKMRNFYRSPVFLRRSAQRIALPSPFLAWKHLSFEVDLMRFWRFNFRQIFCIWWSVSTLTISGIKKRDLLWESNWYLMMRLQLLPLNKWQILLEHSLLTRKVTSSIHDVIEWRHIQKAYVNHWKFWLTYLSKLI